MNEFEQQIRRAFDRMFEEIPVPPANVALPNLERRKRRKRVIQYIAGGVSVATAAGLLVLALLPRAEVDMRGGNIAYDPASHPGNGASVVPADSSGHSGAPSPTTEAHRAETPAGNSGVHDAGNSPRNRVGGTNEENGRTVAGPGIEKQGSASSPGVSENMRPTPISPTPGALDGSSGTAGVKAKEDAKTPSNSSDRVVAAAGETADGGTASAATSSGHAPGGAGIPSDKPGITAQPAASGPVVLRSARALRWTPYTPSFIPPGYEPVVEFPSSFDQPAGTESGTGSDGVKWTYRGPNGEILVIAQQPVRSITGIPLPSPASPYPQEQTTVHGQVAMFQWDGHILHLIWVEGDTRFDISSNTDKHTLLQVADGLAPSPSGPQQP